VIEISETRRRFCTLAEFQISLNRACTVARTWPRLRTAFVPSNKSSACAGLLRRSSVVARIIGSQIALPKYSSGTALNTHRQAPRPGRPRRKAARAIAAFIKGDAVCARAIPFAVRSFTCSQFPNTASVNACSIALAAAFSFELRPSAASKARLENARA